MVKVSVISCLGKLSYEIGVCIEVYHSFVGESCILERAVVYDGILMRSLLVFFAALGILSTQSTLYADSHGSIDLISGMASKTLYNLGKYSFCHNNNHVFLKVAT